MSILVGFVSAIISILGWGSYFVPMKKIREYDPFYFQALMCITIFTSSLIISFLYNSFIFSYLGMLSGILWSLGNVLSIFAVRNSGLSKSTPVWAGLGIFTSFIWGVFFFKESLTSILLGVLGISLIIVGISFISFTTEDRKSSNIKGIVFASIAGLVFGSYLVPLKLSGLQPNMFLFPMSLGILIGGVSIYLFKGSKIDKGIILSGVFSGVAWNIANFASFFAVLNLGIAIGFPLTQMALFVSVLWGVFYFKEIRGKTKVIRLIFWSIILFFGAVLLTLSI